MDRQALKAVPPANINNNMARKAVKNMASQCTDIADPWKFQHFFGTKCNKTDSPNER